MTRFMMIVAMMFAVSGASLGEEIAHDTEVLHPRGTAR